MSDDNVLNELYLILLQEEERSLKFARSDAYRFGLRYCMISIKMLARNYNVSITDKKSIVEIMKELKCFEDD